jgi:2'-5' RNA ligase
MLPDDRLVCGFIRPIAVGDSFQTWPLHITVVPWFRLPDLTVSIVVGLTEALTPIAPFRATATAEALMGPRHNRPVALLAEPTPFQDIEQRVRNYLHKKRAWLVDETTKIQRPFRPHVTVQQIDQLLIGDSFATDSIYIVEQKGDYKQVVGEIKLHPHEQTTT